jgi:hypothetical protein
MGECSAQTKVSASGTTAQNGLPTTLRGLELIKSCAKFYANGAGVAKPTVKLSHRLDAALNGPANRQTSPPLVAKPSISTAAVFGSFVLASLALAAIIWAAATGAAGAPKAASGDASAASVKATSPITAPLNREAAAASQTFATAQSDIIIHKVKTQPIHGAAWEGPRPH